MSSKSDRSKGHTGERSLLLKTALKLSDRDKWLELIQLYSGNPSWLKIIAATIPDFFHGSVNRFLSCSTLFLGNIEATLHAHFQRLSEFEKSLMFWLASQDAAVDIPGKPADFPFSEYDFWQALQSLGRRGLIEKVADRERSPNIADATSLFALAPAIEQYVKEQRRIGRMSVSASP